LDAEKDFANVTFVAVDSGGNLVYRLKPLVRQFRGLPSLIR
jgi:hypothetical protein